MQPNERESVRQRFLLMDTSNVADVLEGMGLMDQGLSPEFRPFPASAGRLAGWAYTLVGQMVPYEGPGDPAKMKACQGLSPGEVALWSGDGEGVCYFGELIALAMKERGSTGALVDGGVRDVRWIGEHGFPIFARYRTPVQSIRRWKVTACQVPAYVRGATVKRVTVAPGDFILGDEDGAIAIPAAVVMDVLAEAERLTGKEVAIRAALANGMTLAEALEKFGHV
jgi:4-hydroxy-4-methyl-2-oxoglutarate aldolase